jgi:hypothetical protein
MQRTTTSIIHALTITHSRIQIQWTTFPSCWVIKPGILIWKGRKSLDAFACWNLLRLESPYHSLSLLLPPILLSCCMSREKEVMAPMPWPRLLRKVEYYRRIPLVQTQVQPMLRNTRMWSNSLVKWFIESLARPLTMCIKPGWTDKRELSNLVNKKCNNEQSY